MFNPDNFTDATKVARYFDLYEQTESPNSDHLPDEEHDLLAAERITLYYEMGLDEVDDEVLGVLRNEHRLSSN